MLLRNYDNLFVMKKLCFNNNGTSYFGTDTDVFGDGHINFKSTSGTIFDAYLNDGNAFIGMVPSYICVGSDVTPVTYDDYKLGAEISGLTDVSNSTTATQSYNYDSEKNVIISEYKIIKSTSNEITIGEIGIKRSINYTQSKSYSCLLLREVLSEPIIVPANANFIITIKVEIPIGENKPTDYVATASVE